MTKLDGHRMSRGVFRPILLFAFALMALANCTAQPRIETLDGHHAVGTAELTITDVANDTYFGWSSAISGNTVVVGALQARVNNQTQGAAFVYVKLTSGWTNMTQTATLVASDALSGFGSSVAVNGNTIVVAAYDQSTGNGALYVFVKPGRMEGHDSDSQVNLF